MRMKFNNSTKIMNDKKVLIYGWVDSIPLTRPKKNISRDFSDGGIAFTSTPR